MRPSSQKWFANNNDSDAELYTVVGYYLSGQPVGHNEYMSHQRARNGQEAKQLATDLEEARGRELWVCAVYKGTPMNLRDSGS